MLIVCPECSAPISDDSAVCSKCGCREPDRATNNAVLGYALAMIGFIVLVVVVGSRLSGA